MRRYLQTTLRLLSTIIVVVALAQVSKASILGSLLSFDGTVDKLSDTSRGVIYDSEASDEAGFNEFSIGDEIYGIIKVDTINGTSTGSPNQKVFAVYSFRINDITLNGAGIADDVFHLGASTVNTLRSLLDDTVETPFSDAALDASIFAFLDSGIVTDALNPFSDVNSIGAGALTPAESIDLFTAANGYSATMLAGIDTSLGSVDFFQSMFAGSVLGNFDTGDGSGGAADGKLQISEVKDESTALSVFSERGGLSIIDHTFGSDIVFLDVKTKAFTAAAGTNTLHSFVITPDGTRSSTALSEWDVRDQTSFQINPVPEPASMLVWAGMLGFFGVIGFWRRKRQAVAQAA